MYNNLKAEIARKGMTVASAPLLKPVRRHAWLKAKVVNE